MNKYLLLEIGKSAYTEFKMKNGEFEETQDSIVVDEVEADSIEEYPKVRYVLPILIAIRNNKIKETRIIDDIDTLISENKESLFNPVIGLHPKFKDDLIKFFRESGLKQIFEDKNIKNVVDYCFGVEVGMDTNARKNRTGTSMESLVE